MGLRARITGLACLIAGATPALAADWLPVTPEELRLTSVPEAPGAPALILYRQVDRNDAEGYKDEYVRTKILTADGRKYRYVELPYFKACNALRDIEVRDIAARTIRPDGTVVPFTGPVLEKQVGTNSFGTLLAKTLQLPDVEPGGIVEYRAEYAWPHAASDAAARFNHAWLGYDSRWILNDILFTRLAKFSLAPHRGQSLRWSWPNGLPAGAEQPHFDNWRVVMQARDVPALVTEDYMPAAAALSQRVDFIYGKDAHVDSDPRAYWKAFGIGAYKAMRDYINEHPTMERALSQIVQRGDSPEGKLRKIYARVQGVRNLSYEPANSPHERQCEVPLAYNVAQIWERNAGSDREINLLFLALAQAAGLQADFVLVARRNEPKFDPFFMNSARLDATAVLVTVDGKELYLNPGVPYTPYGMLPWDDTDAAGARLTPDGGKWIATPTPAAPQSRLERKAALTLSPGGLDGKLTVTYTGFEAAVRRLSQRNEDAVSRRQFLENQLKSSIPVAVEIKLTNNPDWSDSDSSLVAEFDLHVPGWAASTGQRQLLPLGLFSNAERHMFEKDTRTHPIYFEYPREVHDEVLITLPVGWRAESVPERRSSNLKVLVYQIEAQREARSLRITRDLRINFYDAPASSYPAIRAFFQSVRTGDGLQAVISPDGGTAR